MIARGAVLQMGFINDLGSIGVSGRADAVARFLVENGEQCGARCVW